MNKDQGKPLQNQEKRKDELQPQKSLIFRLKMTDPKQNLASLTTVI